MTIVVQLGPAQLQQIRQTNQEARDRVRRSATKVLAPSREFVFFAAFDGTNNDKDDLGGDRQSTNVGQLWDQYVAGEGPRDNLGGHYAPGLGTRGRPTRDTWLPAAVTAEVQRIAASTLGVFSAQVRAWRETHPGGAVKVVLASFSRGSASAAVFAQMLARDGVPATAGGGKAEIVAGVFFDPVATGVAGNLALPPDARNVVSLKAVNEYRWLFRAVDYTQQPDAVTTVGFYGNHCDVGGSYDNGLAAITLEAATAYLRKCGLPLARVPGPREFDAAQMALHSEQRDEHDNELWDVYNEDGFSFRDERRFDEKVVVAPASAPGPDGRRTFTLYDGTQITL